MSNSPVRVHLSERSVRINVPSVGGDPIGHADDLRPPDGRSWCRRRKLPRMTAITTANGRSLEVREGGDPAGFPVVVQHGTPGSGLLWAEHRKLAEEQEIRLVAYDRAGYGGSARDEGRNVAACAADVDAIADALGLERYA